MTDKKIQLVPNKPRKPTGKVVTVQPNDVESELEVSFKVVPAKKQRDKHKEK